MAIAARRTISRIKTYTVVQAVKLASGSAIQSLYLPIQAVRLELHRVEKPVDLLSI